MGRNKIDIKYISDERKRRITSKKRKGGLLAKASQLAILTGASVTVIYEGETFTFGKQPTKPLTQEMATQTKEPKKPTKPKKKSRLAILNPVALRKQLEKYADMSNAVGFDN